MDLQNRLAALLQGKSARNASWMMAGQGSSLLVQTAYFVLLARLLGSFEYGVYAGAFALVSIVSQYSSLGSGTLFIRYVSPDLRRFPVYWGNILLSVAVCGTVLVAGLAVWGKWLIGPASAAILVIVAIADCYFRRLTESAAQVFQAFEQLRYTAFLNTFTNFFRLTIAGFLLLALHHGRARTWALSVASVSLVTCAIAVMLVSRQFGRPSFDLHTFRKHALEGFGFSMASSTGAMYNDVDKAMLSHNGMTIANGIYTMAYRVVDICHIPTSSVHGAMLPRFFRAGVADGVPGSFGLARRVLKRTCWFGLLGAVAMFVCAPVIPYILGSSFSETVYAVRWLCLIPLFRTLHLSAGDGLLASGYQKVRFSLQLSMAIGNYGANLYLIPHYSWRGAAWASLATDGLLGVTSWIAFYCLMKRTTRIQVAV